MTADHDDTAQDRPPGDDKEDAGSSGKTNGKDAGSSGKTNGKNAGSTDRTDAMEEKIERVDDRIDSAKEKAETAAGMDPQPHEAAEDGEPDSRG